MRPTATPQSPAAQAGIEAAPRLLREELRRRTSHHATMLLWASTRLDGLMTAERRDATIDRLRAHPASRRRLEPPLAGLVEASRRHAQRSRGPQRRLCHRPGRLRPPPGGYPGDRPGDPPRRRLAAVAPAGLGPMVHPIRQQRQAPLHHARRDGVRRARAAGLRGHGRRGRRPSGSLRGTPRIGRIGPRPSGERDGILSEPARSGDLRGHSVHLPIDPATHEAPNLNHARDLAHHSILRRPPFLSDLRGRETAVPASAGGSSMRDGLEFA